MRCIYKLVFLWILYSQEMVSRDFARRPSDRGFIEDLDLYYKLLDSFCCMPIYGHATFI
jgi:hypothetical protein